MRIVVKIGGHAFPSKTDIAKVSAYAKLFQELRREGHKTVVVTGGGEDARKYIETARALGASELVCDILGIEVSRLNARLLITALGEDAFPVPPISFEGMREALETGKIVVVGGMMPGQSTDTIGALSSEAVGADLFIKATDVDGVYTADPKKDPSAKKMDTVGTGELLRLVLSGKLGAGGYALFDPVAIKIVERSRIPTRIVDGRNPENVAQVVRGEPLGTLVEPV